MQQCPDGHRPEGVYSKRVTGPKHAGDSQDNERDLDVYAVVDITDPNTEHPRSDDKFARGLRSVDAGLISYEIIYAIAWISSAAASGVIGNLTYDAVKRLLHQLGKTGDVDDELPSENIRDGLSGDNHSREMQEQLAKQTVRARCGEIGWPVPALASLQIVEMKYAHHVWNIVLKGPELEAEVVLAKGSVRYQSIPVTLRTVSPRDLT
jgi:hypothetical protein